MRCAAWLLGVLLVLPASAFAQAAETIPDFCASPDVTLSSGNWSDGGVSAGDIVAVDGAVAYNVSSTDIVEAVCIEDGGTLTFSTGANTKLTVTTLHVKHGGALIIGTPGGTCINSANTAEIAFDGSLDTGADPEQFGLGLIGEGTIRMCGTTKTAFVRFTEELSAAETVFDLESTPTGWASGDTVAIPDSRGRNILDDAAYQAAQRSKFVHENETRTLSGAVSTAQATVSSGVTFAHNGARNKAGSLVFYPHIANLTRNVRVYSTDTSGNARGHVMFHHHADVDIRYVAFIDLGRTTHLDLHCTLRTTGTATDDADCITGTGAVTQTGTNHKGRYAVHFHKMMGPPSAACSVAVTGIRSDHQGCFIGNVIDGSTKWPLTVHDTSYLLIQANVIWDGFGGCLMFEEGNEHYNILDGNLAAYCRGVTYQGDNTSLLVGCASNCADPREHGAREGAGFYLRGFHNYLRNNVAAGIWNEAQQIVSGVGFKLGNGLTLTNAGQVNSTAGNITIRIPDFPGADIDDADEYTNGFMRQQPLLEFDNNEAYGAIAGCITVWYHQDPDSASGSSRATLSDFKCWAFYEDAFFMYPLGRYDLTGWQVYGHYNTTNRAYSHGIFNGDYHVADVTVSDSIFHNLAMCFRGFDNSSSFVVSDTDMACDFGLKRQMFTSGSNGSNPIADQVFLLENVTWEGISGTPIGITGHTSTTDVLVYMHWCASTANADGGNCDDDPFGTNEPDLAHTTTVTNANGNNLTFNVYFLEQEAEDVAGGVSPCSDDTSRPEIRGIACSIQAADVPTGAIGDYSFSEESGGSIPNTVVGQMAAMEISGSDFTTSADGIEWTNDEMYTHESPFDPADGTWADLASAFSEPFNAANAGTVAIRFKVSSTLQSGLGQASFIGLWSFRQNPELNYSAVGQAGMEIARGGPGAPLTIVARTGTVCEGNFNDQVQSGEIADLSEWHTAILVWDATTLRLWIDGVEDVTGNRDCGDWSTDDVQLQMAATSFVTHSDDRQYFTGTTSRFVVYDRELSDPELAELHAALSGDVVEPPPSGQRHRFRFRSSEE